MKTIDFMGKRRLFGAISVVAVIASIIYISMFGVPRNVDFAGGTKLTVLFDRADIAIGDLRQRMAPVEPSATIFSAEIEGNSLFTIKIKSDEAAAGEEASADISLSRLNNMRRVFASFAE